MDDDSTRNDSTSDDSAPKIPPSNSEISIYERDPSPDNILGMGILDPADEARLIADGAIFAKLMSIPGQKKPFVLSSHIPLSLLAVSMLEASYEMSTGIKTGGSERAEKAIREWKSARDEYWAQKESAQQQDSDNTPE